MNRAESMGGHAALDLLEGVGRVHQELDGDVIGGEWHGCGGGLRPSDRFCFQSSRWRSCRMRVTGGWSGNRPNPPENDEHLNPHFPEHFISVPSPMSGSILHKTAMLNGLRTRGSSSSSAIQEHPQVTASRTDPNWRLRAHTLPYGKVLSTNMTLTGTDLLAKVKEQGDVSKSDLVRAAGYVSTKKDGSERLNFTAFYEALLEAKGVSLGDGGGNGKGKGGRKLSYVATVQGNGNLLVGKAYTAMLDLKPGDEFEIKLGRKQIRLIPAGGADEEE